MAIGKAWADGAWVDASWESAAWAQISLIEGIIDVIEEDDVLTAVGYIAQNIEGILNVTEDDDTLNAAGTIVIQFVINILDLNLTIPRADEDAAEQQRILIENLTLIQQALRNLGQ